MLVDARSPVANSEERQTPLGMKLHVGWLMSAVPTSLHHARLRVRGDDWPSLDVAGRKIDRMCIEIMHLMVTAASEVYPIGDDEEADNNE